MTFIHNNLDPDEKNDFKIAPGKQDTLNRLMEDTAKYCYAEWLKHRASINLKESIYKVVKRIYHNEDYKTIYEQDSSKDILTSSEEKVKEDFADVGKGQRGLCLIAAVLNNEQQDKPIPSDVEIEHILPTKWNLIKHTKQWLEEDYDTHKEMLGNLTALEKDLNGKASNLIFEEKKEVYKGSSIAEARELIHLQEWTPQECQERHKKIVNRLSNFFSRK